MGDELNADFAQKVGGAFADWLPSSGTVAVGRDMRPDSGEPADAVIAGCAHRAATCWTLAKLPDMIYFAWQLYLKLAAP